MLRERFAHRYSNRNLFGMYPRSRRGESSRRGEGIGYSLERAGIASRRSMTAKLVEADGAPLVETESLQAMIRVLRIVQVLSKNIFAFVQYSFLFFSFFLDSVDHLDCDNCTNCVTL